MGHSPIIVRASSLPAHHDCGLLWAVENLEDFRQEKKEPDSKPVYHIGAVIGTHAHLAAAMLLSQKMEGDEPDVEAAINYAKTEYRAFYRTSKIKPDGITLNNPDGEVQMVRAIRAWAETYLPTAEPAMIEVRMRATYSDKLIITATPDFLGEMRPGVWKIDDYKFGGFEGSNEAQVGTYAIVVGAQDFFVPGSYVESMEIPWTKRRGIKSKKATETIIIPYDPVACERLARRELDAIEREVDEYRATGDIFAFGPNPRSKFCNKKGCKAWGNICPLGRNKEGDEEGDSTTDDDS